MQPYFLPYLGYWQLVNCVDMFVIYDDVNFMKKSFVNRNNILLNGDIHRFTLELKGASQNKLINQIELGSNRDKLKKTFLQAYKSAPCIEDVSPLLNSIMDCEEINLATFLGHSIQEISAYMGINTKIVYSSDIKHDKEKRGQERIIDIVQSLGGTHYVNAIGGKDLYSKDAFKVSGIDLSFIEMLPFEYEQPADNFVPNLSVIDVLMNVHRSSLADSLESYKLI